MALEIELDEDTAANEAIDAAKARGEAEYSEPETELPPDMEEPAPKAKARVASKKPVERARVAPKKKVEANPLAEPDDAYEGPVKEAAMKAEKATVDALGKGNSWERTKPAFNPKNDAIQSVGALEALVGTSALVKGGASLIAKNAATKLAKQKVADEISNKAGEELVKKGDMPYTKSTGEATTIIRNRPNTSTTIKPNPARQAAMKAKANSNNKVMQNIKEDTKKYTPTEEIPSKSPSVYNKPLLDTQKSKQLEIKKGVDRPPVTKDTREAAQRAARGATEKYKDRAGVTIKHNRY
jgi:hypothetical protein